MVRDETRRDESISVASCMTNPLKGKERAAPQGRNTPHGGCVGKVRCAARQASRSHHTHKLAALLLTAPVLLSPTPPPLVCSSCSLSHTRSAPVRRGERTRRCRRAALTPIYALHLRWRAGCWRTFSPAGHALVAGAVQVQARVQVQEAEQSSKRPHSSLMPDGRSYIVRAPAGTSPPHREAVRATPVRCRDNQ